MKRIVLFLILIMTFAFSAINEYKTDVYFGNGILTTEKDAKYNTGVLRNAIKEKFGLDYYKNHISDVYTAYNHTQGQVLDLLESARQIINKNYNPLNPENYNTIVGLVRSLIESMYNGFNKKIHDMDLKAQIDKYEGSIKKGHRVLVIAHSQGNLFAHEAYIKLGERSKKHGKWLQKYWDAISIASPDPFTDIKPDMPPKIGWDNDLVAWLGNGLKHNGIICKVRRVT